MTWCWEVAFGSNMAVCNVFKALAVSAFASVPMTASARIEIKIFYKIDAIF